MGADLSGSEWGRMAVMFGCIDNTARKLMADFNVNIAGFCIAALFIGVWAAALAYWRWGNVESRWTANVPGGPAQESGNPGVST
jgi:hypothetical protein